MQVISSLSEDRIGTVLGLIIKIQEWSGNKMFLSRRLTKIYLVLPLQMNFNMKENVIYDCDRQKWTMKRNDHSGPRTWICTFVCSKSRGLGLCPPLNLCFTWEKICLKPPFGRRMKKLDNACEQKFEFSKEHQICDRNLHENGKTLWFVNQVELH